MALLSNVPTANVPASMSSQFFPVPRSSFKKRDINELVLGQLQSGFYRAAPDFRNGVLSESTTGNGPPNMMEAMMAMRDRQNERVMNRIRAMDPGPDDVRFQGMTKDNFEEKQRSVYATRTNRLNKGRKRHKTTMRPKMRDSARNEQSTRESIEAMAKARALHRKKKKKKGDNTIYDDPGARPVRFNEPDDPSQPGNPNATNDYYDPNDTTRSPETDGNAAREYEELLRRAARDAAHNSPDGLGGWGDLGTIGTVLGGVLGGAGVLAGGAMAVAAAALPYVGAGLMAAGGLTANTVGTPAAAAMIGAGYAEADRQLGGWLPGPGAEIAEGAIGAGGLAADAFADIRDADHDIYSF